MTDGYDAVEKAEYKSIYDNKSCPTSNLVASRTIGVGTVLVEFKCLCPKICRNDTRNWNNVKWWLTRNWQNFGKWYFGIFNCMCSVCR